MRCPECGQKECCGASLAFELDTMTAERDDHDMWLRHMVEDYRLDADENTNSRRVAINHKIHEFRAECGKLRQHAEALEDAARAYQELNVCYRMTKRPPEKLFKRLDKANKALDAYRAEYPRTD